MGSVIWRIGTAVLHGSWNFEPSCCFFTEFLHLCRIFLRKSLLAADKYRLLMSNDFFQRFFFRNMGQLNLKPGATESFK